MELNLDNLVEEIVKQESRYRYLMVYAKENYGEDYYFYNYWEAKWSILYYIAVKFGFVDKLIM